MRPSGVRLKVQERVQADSRVRVPRDVPESLVVKTLHFHYRENRLGFWSGNCDPAYCTVWQKKKRRAPNRNTDIENNLMLTRG